MPPPPRIHNLGHNRSEHSPPRVMFWDTETRPDQVDGGETHRLRLWCADLVERDGPTRKRPRATRWEGHTVAELCDAVEDASRGGRSLWMFAHNLGFDLAVTGLPVALGERGWEVTQHALTGASPWLRMKRGDRGITMVDSASWLPVPEARLGDAVGIPKPPLPDFADPDEVWYERCRADVAILRAAVLQLLDWWDGGVLGHWSLSGPATGFNSYRHMGRSSAVVINPDPELRATERAVITGGRAECWRVGELPAAHYVLVDFAHAFGSVVANLPLPRKHARRFDRLDPGTRCMSSDGIDLLATVELECATPRYPLRTRRGVVHPVGRFCTTLCGPEIREAHRRGELRAIGPGLMYFTTPHMARWGRWALEVIDNPDTEAPAVARIAVKAWTRTVPGRWAGRASRVTRTFEQPLPGWRLERGEHWPGRAPFATLDMNGTRYWMVQDQEMDNGFPAVLAWIQSHVRLRLGRLIDLVGEYCVVLCNTDGVVIDLDAFTRTHDAYAARFLGPTGRMSLLSSRLDAWARECAPLRPAVKWSSRTLEVLSPQHVITDHHRQLSGVPGSAEAVGEHVYSFTDWPRLSTQLTGGWEGGYVRRRRSVDLSTVPVLRWVREDGSCVPVEASGRLGGQTALLAPTNGHNGASGPALRPRQHPALAGLL
ncbi:MAG TPA: hypothetical protein VHQ90_00175 [Thermoanaerobaculia bacterium]|nr:hypothetical protein [Thermoanaerobaculia bacterium]